MIEGNFQTEEELLDFLGEIWPSLAKQVGLPENIRDLEEKLTADPYSLDFAYADTCDDISEEKPSWCYRVGISIPDNFIITPYTSEMLSLEIQSWTKYHCALYSGLRGQWSTEYRVKDAVDYVEIYDTVTGKLKRSVRNLSGNPQDPWPEEIVDFLKELVEIKRATENWNPL